MDKEKEIMRHALMTGIHKNFRMPNIGGGVQIWYKLDAVKTDYQLKAIDESVDGALCLCPCWTPAGGKPQMIDTPAWLALIYNPNGSHATTVAFLKEKHIAVLALVVPPGINDTDAKKLLRSQTRGKTWINQSAKFAPFDIDDGKCIRRRWCDICQDWSIRASGTCYSCEKREKYHECSLCGKSAKRPYPLCWSCYQRSLARVETPEGDFQHESNTASLPRGGPTHTELISAKDTKDIDTLLAEMNLLLEEEDGHTH